MTATLDQENENMKHIVMLSCLCALVSGCGKPSPDVQGVQHAFDAYKQAILSTDGAKSAKHIAQRTFDEYQQYVDWALQADRNTLEGLSAINKMQVFLMKHRIPKDEWRNMTGKKVFIYAVDHDWIGKQQTITTMISDIQVSGTRATAAVIIGKKKAPNRFHFTNEDGFWKFDLTQTLRDTDFILRSQIKQSGMTEDEFMFRIIESISGTKVTDSIWEPIGKK